MSILAEMLAEFCPNGVELKKVADVTTVARGIRVVRNQLVEEGEFPVYQNSMKPLGHLPMIFDAKWQNFCVRKIPMPMPVQAQGS